MFGIADVVPTRWRCSECKERADDDVDREKCACNVTTPTPALQIVFEPIPTNAPIEFQIQMVEAKLRVSNSERERAGGEARYQDRYDPDHAAGLRADEERWKLRAQRIRGELRSLQAQLKPRPKKASAKKARTAPVFAARRAPRAKSPRSMAKPAGRPATTVAKTVNSPGGDDGPGSGDPAPAPSDPAPEMAPAAGATVPVATALPSPRRSKQARLEEALRVWQPRTKRPLSLEDARQISETATAVVRLLAKWAAKPSASSGSPPSTRPAPGASEGTSA